MDTDVHSAQKLTRNILTIRQQVNNLKTKLEERQGKLALEKKACLKENRPGINFLNMSKIKKCIQVSPNQENPESLKIVENYHSLLNEEPSKETWIVEQCTNEKVVEKKPYLKKGEGLLRYRMKLGGVRLKKQRGFDNQENVHSNESKQDLSSNKVQGVELCDEEKSSPLKAFENLEQRIKDTNFCSNSFITQLMEDSIKSTPIKNVDDIELNRTNFAKRNLHHSNQEFFTASNLDIIDEESSRLDNPMNDKSDDNYRVNSVMIRSSNYISDNFSQLQLEYNPDQKNNDYSRGSNSVIMEGSNCTGEKFSSTEYQTSECSSGDCSCDDVTNYLSTSVSVFTEETSIYSPIKKEPSRTIRCARTDQKSLNVDGCEGVCAEDNSNVEEFLEARQIELEAEIEAFKMENSKLAKLKNDYEKQYKDFREERMKLLAEIREEHLKGAEALEEEKKKLQIEKLSFQRHMREVKNRPNKQEKEEIRLLKEEVALMKEEMNKKESRWGAAQARIRTEVKLLKDRNSALEEELKELKKSNKKVTFAPTLKKSKLNPNINAINKEAIKSPSNEMNKSTSSVPLDNINADDIIFKPGSIGLSCETQIENSRSIQTDYNSMPENVRRSICVSSYLSDDLTMGNVEKNLSECSKDSNDVIINENTDSSGDLEKLFANGRKEIWYSNGSVKKISPDGNVIINIYYNDDVEQILVGKQVKYYHASSKTWHTTFCDGRPLKELTEFPNGQVEKYFNGNFKEVISSDGTVCTISPEEKKWYLVDGTVITENEERQEKRSVFPNGEFEIHTTEYKKRGYPNGTTKIVYNSDGRQETRYPNGRVRVKDRNGNLISDTEII